MSVFIKVSAYQVEDHHDVIELPLEEDSTLLLSTIHAQFPQATGLKYLHPDSGVWRGVRLVDGVLSPSSEGWGDITFVAVFPESAGMNSNMGDSNKRKLESGSQESELDRAPKNPRHGLGRSSREASPFAEMCNSPYDLIVLGIPYKAMEEDMKEYFEQFGDLELCELKRNAKTNESRGFGFIRFITSSDRESVLARPEHYLLGRLIEVKVPRKSEDLPRKVFVGQLPHEPERSELATQFEKYGNIIDVYVPKPFRGFGFVTFQTGEEAQRALLGGAELNGNILNVTCANPKPSQDRIQRWKVSREQQQNPIYVTGPSYPPAASYPQENSRIIYRGYPFDFNFQPKLPSAIMRYTPHPNPHRESHNTHNYGYAQSPSPAASYSSPHGATKYSVLGHQQALPQYW
ncbi:TAR DNA-binding protein 43-like [Oopsacas minuta]|uniref:TAR DNA-binding protein 43-like n=1 Tax=Oopsacas minuta TaxID=111878 RepID=A0AAV7JDZ9_9METZ|nr:TAR DNA-binding protein 43-like [Oopsacas minuta]